MDQCQSVSNCMQIFARTQTAVTTTNAMQTSTWIPKTQRIAYVSCNLQWCLPSLVISNMIILYHVILNIKSYLLAFFFQNALSRFYFHPLARFLVVEREKNTGFLIVKYYITFWSPLIRGRFLVFTRYVVQDRTIK